LLNLNEDRLEDIKTNNETSFSGSLIDGDELLQKIPSSNKTVLPRLISNKQDLEKELLNRGYSEFMVKTIVDSLRYK
jgi:hypothetical protein